MITLYSGTPGAGKSLHVARTIYTRLRVAKRDVIATFPINMDVVTNKGRKKTANFIYRDITDMTTDYLIKYALEHHKLGKENQTLVVIDECQIIFNPREFSRADRLKWIVFFTQHRKLGFDFILISQFDRLIDRQIRCLLEYNVIHRKANNLGILWLFPIKFFVAVSVWYGAKVKCGQEFFIYRKKYGKMYDSFMMFDDDFRSYVKENGEKVSEFNKNVLNLNAQDKPKLKPQADDDINEIEVIADEVERYAHLLHDLPDEAGSKSVIINEISEAMNSISCNVNESDCERINQSEDSKPPQPDKAVSVAEPSDVEVGVRGSLPKHQDAPQTETRIARIWRLMNTPITFKRSKPTEASDAQ